MNRNFDKPANGLGDAAMRRRASRKLGIGFVGGALACAGLISAWADWTPPESSVTPPAVVTLDAFAARDANGGAPLSGLVAGPDGALYGSTPTGGAIGSLAPDGRTVGFGTLFRFETNGTFTRLHNFNGTDGSEPRLALTLGPDGALYGSTFSGGTSNAGTLFRLKTDGTFTKLHDFTGFDGYQPWAALVVGPDGALYGSTQLGGSYFNSGSAPYGWGTLFRLDTDGTFTKLHDFDATNGRDPALALVVGPDGALYGSTTSGGASNVGTLFRIQTDGGFTKLNDFNVTNGAYPAAALVVGPDGALYGSTMNGGSGGDGTLFRWQTNGTFTTMYSFNSNDGQEPLTALVVGSDGALYGSARYGGINGVGTMFRLETGGTFTKLHDFTYTNDVYLSGFRVVGLIVGPDGALYGSTLTGGLGRYGTLFRLQTNGTFTKLHDFDGTDGWGPLEMTAGPDGALYGPTSAGSGPTFSGTLFRLQTNGAFSNLYNFAATEGNNPMVALVAGSDSALYGSTVSGGTNGSGTLFRVEANGTFTKLHDFNDTYGSAANPPALVVGPDGALYGSTVYGGTSGYGTLFQLKTDGTFTKLYDLNFSTGWASQAPLVVGSDGALYGSTVSGGATGNGTLLRLGTNGTLTKLHDFNYGEGIPRTALVLAPDGALYGSTYNGGTNGYGTLFQLKTDGTFTKLYDFNGTNGAYPLAALVAGPDGALYGSTYQGGNDFRRLVFSGYGTLFKVQTNGTFTKLHDFNLTDGAVPTTAMVVGPDGALYGTTQYGGTSQPPQGVLYGYGTLFQVKTDGTFTKLHDFDFADGVRPVAPLVDGPDGALYGTTQYGGTGQPPQGGPYDGYGTLFQLKINGTFTKLYDFNGTNGARTTAALVVGPGGCLYGTTPYAGPRRGGILFKVVLNRSPILRTHNVTVTAGANCAADASVDDGSFDPDAGDTITLRQEPPGPYPVGVTPVTLTVTDNHGATASCTATVTVMDLTPPAIRDVAATPNVLWPPNHKMVEVTVNYASTDKCGAVSNALSVTSNEAIGAAPDWVIEDNHHVQLRAERSSTGAGRVYAITVISTDNAGNSNKKTVTVTAPRNQN